jgi:regulator-associated protein of mTOR
MATLLARAFGVNTAKNKANPINSNNSSNHTNNISNEPLSPISSLSSLALNSPHSSSSANLNFLSLRSPTSSKPVNILANSATATAAAGSSLITPPILIETKEYYSSDRHQSCRDILTGEYRSKYDHRSSLRSSGQADYKTKDKTKTSHVALVVCLNIGVEPPDAERVKPHAVTHSWIDPAKQPSHKSLELIGQALQEQYERWQPKAKYKQCLDPTTADIKKLCVGIRRSAKQDRVLFHYNGAGVPRPTSNGEVWVFNSKYTQYIPLSVYDLQSWLGNPSIYVLDCNAAGMIIDSFQHFAKQKLEEYNKHAANNPNYSMNIANNNSAGRSLASETKSNSENGVLRSESFNSGRDASLSTASVGPLVAPNYKDCILLAACSSKQSLPASPDLPADLFTCCLTTPLKTALRFFASNSFLTNFSDESLIDQIPGSVADRKTPLGELNWIFTAITDTIAWDLLPRDLFQQLFRQDLLLSSLFRNFLLADRIMRHYGCSPVSIPALPRCDKHPLWASWDAVAESYLLQLDKYIHHRLPFSSHSQFFAEHLTAFEIWLEVGNQDSAPAQQLPIVLQVLLSQNHRRRALVLLAKFLGKGHWAVTQALSVGILPYIWKLLQSPAAELREVLVFIWTKVMAFDPSLQSELLREGGYIYFINHLADSKLADRQRVMSAFILSAFCSDFAEGQAALIANPKTLPIFSLCMEAESPILRRWSALCLAKLFHNNEAARCAAISVNLHEKLVALVADPVPEVRAACLLALNQFMSRGAAAAEHRDQRVLLELALGKQFSGLVVDASPLVREELILTLAALIEGQQAEFMEIAHEKTLENHNLEHSLVNAAVVSLKLAKSTTSGPVVTVSAQHTPTTGSNPLAVTLGPLSRAFSEPHSAGITSSLADSNLSAVKVSSSITHAPKFITSQKNPNHQSPVVMAFNSVLAHNNGPNSASSEEIKLSATVLASPPSSNQNLIARRPSAVTPLKINQENSGPISRLTAPQAQRLLIWRVVRSLCHDPYPTASRAALTLRKSVLNGTLLGHNLAEIFEPSSPHTVASSLISQSPVVQQQAVLDGLKDLGLVEISGESGASMKPSLAPLRTVDIKESEIGPGRPRDIMISRNASSPLLSNLANSFSAAPRASIDQTESLRALSGNTGITISTVTEEISLLHAAPHLPRSTIYERSVDYFAAPMQDHCDDPEESLEKLLTKDYRNKRNAEQLSLTRAMNHHNYDAVKQGPFDQIAVLPSGFESVSSVLFHPYENILYVADSKRHVAVWDYMQLEKINQFNNENSKSSKISTLKLMNENHLSLLLCGSDDGVVKIWRNSHEKDGAEIVSAWLAIRNMTRGSHPGLLLDWQQLTGHLICAGAADSIRVWDVEREICMLDLSLHEESYVSSITSSLDGNQLYAGYSDGAVKLFDLRQDNNHLHTSINQINKHNSNVVSVHLQRGGEEEGKLLSGSLNGEIFVNDVRFYSTETTLSSILASSPLPQTHKLTAFAKPGIPLDSLIAHDYAPIFASGSRKQLIRLCDFNNNPVAELKYHKGFMGHRIGPVTSLAFHPHKLLLAAGALNPYISILAATPQTNS